MEYWLKVVFVDNQELALENTQKHFISDDLEVLETAKPAIEDLTDGIECGPH